MLCSNDNKIVIQGDRCWVENQDFPIPEHLSNEEADNLKQVLRSHQDSFADTTSQLGTCSCVKMEIKLTTDKPICAKPYRLPFAKRPILSDIVNDLLESNIIRISDSSYASPVVLVDKANGEHRLCIDYRSLNQVTEKMPFQMPIMEEQFAQLSEGITPGES